MIVAVAAAGCGGAADAPSKDGVEPGGAEPTATAAQADTTSDLLTLIADSANYVSFAEDPSVAGAIALVSLANDAWTISLEGDSDPSSSSSVQARMNHLQSEINQLYAAYSELDDRERADAIALNFDIANGARAQMEGWAQYLSANIGTVLAHTASDGVTQVLAQDVDSLEQLITVQIEPAIENPAPGAYPVGDAYWFQTYEMALDLRLALAVAGFPMDRDWALARYLTMNGRTPLPSGFTSANCVWTYPTADSNCQTTSAPLAECNGEGGCQTWQAFSGAWENIVWAMMEPYRALRGAADFDGDGVPDLVFHDPATGQVFVTRMVPATTEYTTYLPGHIPVHHVLKSFQSGWAAQGWVKTLGTLDAASWHLNAIADLDHDGSPDLVWHNVQPGHLATQGTRVWFTHDLTVTSDTGLDPSNVAAPDFRGLRCIGSFGASEPGYLAESFGSLLEQADPSFGNMVIAMRDPAAVTGTALDITPPSHSQVSMPLATVSFTAPANSWTSEDAVGTPYLEQHWHLRGCADLNGDGVADAIWYHGGDTDGALQAWLSAGVRVSPQVPGQPSGVGIQVQPTAIGEHGAGGQDIRAIADFTGDGKPDLLWQDDDSKALYVTALDGVADGRDTRNVSLQQVLVIHLPPGGLSLY